MQSSLLRRGAQIAASVAGLAALALGALPATTITKHYTQLKVIADDADDARVYGGIHWRYDQDAGNVLGRAVASEVVKNNLRPVHP